MVYFAHDFDLVMHLAVKNPIFEVLPLFYLLGGNEVTICLC